MSTSHEDAWADRMPPLAPEILTPAQQRAAAAIVSGRRGALFGPFIPLLRSPELLDRTQRLGEYLRYDCTIPQRLRELAILVTARHYDQTYEWYVHAPAAAGAGLAASVITAIAARSTPAQGQPDEQTVHAFCSELLAGHSVSDATYARALALLGEAGVVDLCGLCGYYGLLALVLNVARTPLPEGVVPWGTQS
jgi:4-carboxymuconolactone decarboxylase